MFLKLLRLQVLAGLLAAVASAHALVLAVNEGVSYRVGNDEVRARYAPVAADLARLLGEPVRVEPVSDYAALRKGLAGQAWDLALVHPAHISIAALKTGQYRLVAVAKGWQNYQATFIVRADSPLKSLAELRGLKLGLPDEDSITAWMVRATLRETLGDAQAATLQYTRYQDAVPFMVQHTFTQAGASASPAIVRQWQEDGGRIIGRSRPVPIKHLIAGPAITPEQLLRVREYFIGLEASEAGRRKLEALKVPGYAAQDAAALLKLGDWLGL